MSRDHSYELYIDAFTPGTIPMERLAVYMASFSQLLGESEHVHFAELKSGSLCLAVDIDQVARPKVDKRLDEVCHGGGAQSAKQAVNVIDSTLAKDNAVGRVLRNGASILEFPGRTKPKEEVLGPVRQPGALEGEVIQVGGRDDTINVHLRVGDHQVLVCVTKSKEIARRLAQHLFGSRIRVTGTGTWVRLESGDWILSKFEISNAETLDDTPLSKLFSGLRTRQVPPAGGRMNPIELIGQLRDE